MSRQKPGKFCSCGSSLPPSLNAYALKLCGFDRSIAVAFRSPGFCLYIAASYAWFCLLCLRVLSAAEAAKDIRSVTWSTHIFNFSPLV
mmetsp:Transcript_50061/g.98175  ORF Transcript_50061/g.98175 Transcript_50061/m.98175 type:complete len:88 (-) Transcript_50061:338-601(-)